MDGHIVYQGLAKDSVDHFAQFGYRCSKFANPADYWMRILAINYPKTEDDTKAINLFVDKYN